MSLILTPFSLLLDLLNGVFSSYGIAIIVFAVIVKILLFPFSIKGKRGMIQMNMISGQMAKLKQQYGKDPERYNKEVQDLYTREKVNPLGGCLWTLLPLFVLLPLYAIIRQPIENLMGLTEEQIFQLANQLHWETVAVDLGMVTQEAVNKALEKSANSAIVSGFANEMYNQLYLASLIPEVGLTLTDGTAVSYMNFELLGMNLTRIPNWKIWQDMSLQNLMSLLLVAISAVSGIIFSKVTQKTNKMASNQPKNEQMEQMNRNMMYTMPIMSVWIGLIMPSIMVIYWITNNIMSMILEMIAGQILKKDYEEMRLKKEEEARQEKEQEKKAKEEKVKEIERKREELASQKGKNKPKKKKKVDTTEETEKIDKSESREGMRTYARGRSYKANRYPNPYELSAKNDGNKNDGNAGNEDNENLVLPAPEFKEMDQESLDKLEAMKQEEVKAPEDITWDEILNPEEETAKEMETSSFEAQELESGRDVTATEEEISDWEAQKRSLKEENTEDE